MHIVTATAEHDLAGIWLYIRDESGSPTMADRQILSLTERFRLLADFPHLGRNRDRELGPGRRSYPVGQYIVVYVVVEPDVYILRVAHGKRDLPALIRDKGA